MAVPRWNGHTCGPLPPGWAKATARTDRHAMVSNPQSYHQLRPAKWADRPLCRTDTRPISARARPRRGTQYWPPPIRATKPLASISDEAAKGGRAHRANGERRLCWQDAMLRINKQPGRRHWLAPAPVVQMARCALRW